MQHSLHLISDIFNFAFDFSDEIFVRPKTPSKQVADVDNNLAG
jgi:hypothetical protein